jgi:hypothetical protein
MRVPMGARRATTRRKRVTPRERTGQQKRCARPTQESALTSSAEKNPPKNPPKTKQTHLQPPLVGHGRQERHVQLLHAVRAHRKIERLCQGGDLHPAGDAADV